MIIQHVSRDSLAFRLPKVRCAHLGLTCDSLRVRVCVASESVEFSFSVVKNETSKKNHVTLVLGGWACFTARFC